MLFLSCIPIALYLNKTTEYELIFYSDSVTNLFGKALYEKMTDSITARFNSCSVS